MARTKRPLPIDGKFRVSLTFAATALATAAVLAPTSPRAGRAASEQARPQVVAAYAKLPLHFEANQGQTNEQVRFLARGSGYGLFLTPTESVLVLRKTEGSPAVLRMKLLGANPRPVVAGREKLPGRSNYFIGNDSKKWRTNVPHYARVEYQEVYPGVDLAYYGNQGQFEYDFVVKPGADPRRIRIAIEGADAVRVDGDGNLVLSLQDGEIVERAPVVYQIVGGATKTIDGRFVLSGAREVAFEVGAYDRDRPLVLDPLLVYSTYLGGSDEEQGQGIAVDSVGNAYVAGFTFSTNFPTANPLQAANGGGYDAFVSKVNASGSALVYSTYFGGSGFDQGQGIAVDASGNAYVTGITQSTNFPTANPLQATIGGFQDAFVARLNTAGSALVYSTYLGGSDFDSGYSVAVDASGNAYVTGITQSTDFPTASPLQAVIGGGNNDAFVAELNAAGSALVYSTYLGGSGDELAQDIAVDASANAYLTGFTFSTNFPTANPVQPANGGSSDAFVARVDADGSALAYSTYLGGSGSDQGTGIAVDTSGNAYVTGFTASTNFPTANPLQAANNGGLSDGFVAKVNAAGSSLVYSTYLGGSGPDFSGEDRGHGIAVDASGNAYVTGVTGSANFPTANPLQATKGGSNDAFVAKVNATGSLLVYSTYLGGLGGEFGYGIAVDQSGAAAYIAGFTTSTDFPTANPVQAANGGGYDAFVAKIGPGTPPPNDFNADGKVDMLWRDQGNSGHIALWFMDGARMTHGRLTNPSPFPLLNWQIVGTGDFDSDGMTDILWRDQGSTGHIAVWFMDGTRMKSGTLIDPSPFPFLNWRIVGTGDFNADGKPDILWRDQGNTGSIAVWFMDGTTMTSATLTNPGSFPLLNWEIVGTGDFNGDGKTDILWRDTQSAGHIAVWFMDGTTMTSAVLTDPPAFPLLNWEIQAVGDYDGDGKPDLLWRDQKNSGKIAIWFMDGITRKSATLTNPDGFPILSWRIVGPK